MGLSKQFSEHKRCELTPGITAPKNVTRAAVAMEAKMLKDPIFASLNTPNMGFIGFALDFLFFSQADRGQASQHILSRMTNLGAGLAQAQCLVSFP